MGRQTVLPFKLQRTEAQITARSGLALYAEFLHAMGVAPLIDRDLPPPRSGRGLQASHYVVPLSLTLYGGGDTIEDVRELRDDHTLRTALDLTPIPSSAAIGDWLKRMGRTEGLQGMAQVNEAIARQVLTQDARTEYTLLVDPTIIEAEKREAQMTYLGIKGYRPVVATLKELRLVIASTFKAGNDTGGEVDILRQAFQTMPRGKAITTVLLDAEYYTDAVMAYLTAQRVRWAIAADKDTADPGPPERCLEATADSRRAHHGPRSGRDGPAHEQGPSGLPADRHPRAELPRRPVPGRVPLPLSGHQQTRGDPGSGRVALQWACSHREPHQRAERGLRHGPAAEWRLWGQRPPLCDRGVDV